MLRLLALIEEMMGHKAFPCQAMNLKGKKKMNNFFFYIYKPKLTFVVNGDVLPNGEPKLLAQMTLNWSVSMPKTKNKMK